MHRCDGHFARTTHKVSVTSTRPARRPFIGTSETCPVQKWAEAIYKHGDGPGLKSNTQAGRRIQVSRFPGGWISQERGKAAPGLPSPGRGLWCPELQPCAVSTTEESPSPACAPVARTRRVLCGTGEIAHPGRLPRPCPQGLLFLPRLLLFAFPLRRADARLPPQRLPFPTSCNQDLPLQPRSHSLHRGTIPACWREGWKSLSLSCTRRVLSFDEQSIVCMEKSKGAALPSLGSDGHFLLPRKMDVFSTLGTWRMVSETRVPRRKVSPTRERHTARLATFSVSESSVTKRMP